MTPSPPCARWDPTAACEPRGPPGLRHAVEMLAGRLRAAAEDLAELLLPSACVACDAPGSAPLCPRCLADCPRPAGPCCAACGAPWTVRRGVTGACGRCLRFGRPFAFDTAVGLWHYRGTVRLLVHAFKYGGRQDLLQPLGARLAGCTRVAAVTGARCAPLLVPVPARRTSRRRRGYDQAVGLAQGFARIARLELDTGALRRRRETGPQAGRSRARRRRQAAAAFRARPARVQGRHVLLLDDVLSTGATADAASRALLCAGAVSVRVVVLAT
jgi:ComF family protein